MQIKGGFGCPYLFLSFITGTRILCTNKALGRIMKHNRISDTVFDVTELYRKWNYPDRLLQWSLKGKFFRKAVCWYLRNRFNVIVRNKTDMDRQSYLLAHGTEFMLRDIEIRENNDPTALIGCRLSELFVLIELYLGNPCNLFLTREPLCKLSRLDLPSDHDYDFVLLKPKKRSNSDPYAFRVMGKKHYYLALRLENKYET